MTATIQRGLLVLGVFCTTAAIAAAGYLWVQNVRLRDRLAERGPDLEASPVRRVREGDVLPAFEARDTDGKTVVVAERGAESSLLLIYSPSCDRCEAGMPAWRKLSAKLTELKAPVRVVGLSVADSYDTVDHARASKLAFRAVPFPNIELQQQYGVTETPLTVVVDGQGAVRAVWNKPLEDGDVGDVLETVCPECLERAAHLAAPHSTEESTR